MSVYFVLALSACNALSGRAGRIVLALYALHLGAGPVTVGILAATFSAFPMVFSWHAGRIADRFGARWLLLIGSCASGLGLLLRYFDPGLPAIFLAAATMSITLAVYNVSLQNLVGLLSKAHERARNFSN